MKRWFFLAVLIICGSLLSCRQAAKDAEKQPATQEHTASTAGHVPPNHARILGEIVEIESATFDPPDVESPCSKAPCVAKVRVISVMTAGMGFPQPFLEGTTYRMKFAYTLNPTETILPDMQPSLPGLHAGLRFKADIAGYETLEGDIQPRYTVFSYERQ
ncbi:MAG: hypothetical protein KF749_17530 [Bacteroidetes bacterium]|nr:hypothetical protein [Bacteroidota bacterium]MCW5894150.1 hypothetical protein [Bacteroidota bacterium]